MPYSAGDCPLQLYNQKNTAVEQVHQAPMTVLSEHILKQMRMISRTSPVGANWRRILAIMAQGGPTIAELVILALEECPTGYLLGTLFSGVPGNTKMVPLGSPEVSHRIEPRSVCVCGGVYMCIYSDIICIYIYIYIYVYTYPCLYIHEYLYV